MNEKAIKPTFILLLFGLVVTLVLAACSQIREIIPDTDAGQGGPERGRELIQSYGCHSCHTIPGVPGADSLVGPPLITWSERQFIAGSLPNTVENLVFWIMEPQSVEPGTAMPDMGVDEQDARDIAAYLFTLERSRFLDLGGND